MSTKDEHQGGLSIARGQQQPEGKLSRAGEINIRRQGTNRASTDGLSKNTVKLHSQRQQQSDFCSEYWDLLFYMCAAANIYNILEIVWVNCLLAAESENGWRWKKWMKSQSHINAVPMEDADTQPPSVPEQFAGGTALWGCGLALIRKVL